MKDIGRREQDQGNYTRQKKKKPTKQNKNKPSWFLQGYFPLGDGRCLLADYLIAQITYFDQVIPDSLKFHFGKVKL